MTFAITMKAVASFDPSAISRIIKNAENANRKNLQKAGALLRLIARRSLRRRKKASSPGTPPSVRSKHPYATLKNIRYEVGKDGALVVGPVLFKQPTAQDRLATNAQEFGGTVRRMVKRRTKTVSHRRSGARRLSPAQASAFKRKLAQGSVVRPVITKVAETIRLPKRPTMAPALSSALPKIPSIWKGTVLQ